MTDRAAPDSTSWLADALDHPREGVELPRALDRVAGVPLRQRSADLLKSGKRADIVEMLVILGVTQILLVVSELVFGGSTAIGGAVGWLGLVLGAALVYGALRLRGAGWSTVGLGRPPSWPLTLVLGLATAVAVVIIANFLMTLVILPLVGSPDSSRFAALRGNPLLLVLGLFGVWTSAAFGEEIVFRGYLIGRVAGLLGGERVAWIGAVLLSSIIFGAVHFYQGLSGIIITGSIGLLFGIAYLVLRRNLWPLVIAHGLIDTLSFIQIYSAS
jgi:membrane protease YdiL (CAAX protease family)